MSVPHPKGGNVVWDCVRDHIIDEKNQCTAIGLNRFDYKLIEEEEGEGTGEVLDRYPYLNHLIQLLPGY